ncbi:Zn-ribbon domain-containing OB-fold protein [Devosia ginsengisoli]|uniref:Zn-ribbon domain-containing OB-fold protein n=1 Tax=Devosia ginsengisoli TaxID=400770 RepID=UPI0026EBC05C|nr:Zn-ribbon domain-containing OB-fold protein [Devosia ginsengisoli]MCR6672616.1 Zn-ribbon domain-containing OB-fold protein [Devosia ginsengisoli]
MQPTGRTVPAPQPDAESQPFWDAAAQGRFLIKRCTSCGETHWFPRTMCPFCWSEKTEWVEASGAGTIYSWTVMRRAKPPYAVAYVELAEGPRMLTNIVECDLDRLHIGQQVELVFGQTSGDGTPPVPMFRPTGA